MKGLILKDLLNLKAQHKVFVVMILSSLSLPSWEIATIPWV